MEYHKIPKDEEVLNEFSACINIDPVDPASCPPSVSGSLSKAFEGSMFHWDPIQENLKEKMWPLGPVTRLNEGRVWPFIFISTSGDYSDPPLMDRYLIASVVSVHVRVETIPPPLLELPQVTAAFGVLEDMSKFLPTSSPSLVPHISSKFQFYLKSALPFGSPVCTSIDILDQQNSSSATYSDQQYLQNPQICQSSRRIPAWRPFVGINPSIPSNSSAVILLVISEELQFEIPHSYCTVIGSVDCNAEQVSGTPEIIVPVATSAACNPTITLDNSAKITEVFSTNPSSAGERLTKISFIPPIANFSVCNYHYRLPMSELKFPIWGEFSLMQVSQTKFRFRLNLKLKKLFKKFFILFKIIESTDVIIPCLENTELSPRTKIEVTPDGLIRWTLKNPSTFSADNGEFAEGIVDIGQQHPGDITRHADCHFILSEGASMGSNFAIDPKQVSIFPNSNKTNVEVDYIVASQRCTLMNSAVESNIETAKYPEIFDDCIVAGA